MITTDLGSATGSYIPNCSGTYNPCSEAEKAKSVGMPVPDSITAKCVQFKAACGRSADMAAVKASVTKYMTATTPTAATGSRYQPTASTSTGDTPINVTEGLPTNGETIDPATGLPVVPWYMNKTYWLIGGAVLVGVWLLKR